nr:hypothetical protein [Gluconacetobacter azotocaptans]
MGNIELGEGAKVGAAPGTSRA